jgi:Ca2+-binding RTX toxin-like protein
MKRAMMSVIVKLAKRTMRAARRPQSLRLTLEALEQRDVPAAVADYFIGTNLVFIKCDQSNDELVVNNDNGYLTIRDNGQDVVIHNRVAIDQPLYDAAGNLMSRSQNLYDLKGHVRLTMASNTITVWGNDGDDRVEVGNHFGGSPTSSPVYVRAVLNGGIGNDTLTGTDFADEMRGGEGNDLLFGQAGDDVMDGGAASDLMYGGEGDDILSGDVGNDTIEGGMGRDWVRGDAGNDFLMADTWYPTPYSGNDTLEGGANDDSLFGGAGNDFLYGNDGNDVVHGNAGYDFICGNAGNDQLFGDDGNDFVYGGDQYAWLYTAQKSQTVYGDDRDQLFGGYGDDRLWGGWGSDMLNGGSGADALDGGLGADVIYFSIRDRDTRAFDPLDRLIQPIATYVQ